MTEDFQILPHPVYPIPTREQAAANPKEVAEYLLKRNERIELENADPYRYGYRPSVWERVEAKIREGFREILVLGGNRGSKSEYGGQKAVETMLKGEKRRVWCLQSTEPNSVEMQQPIVWKYVPLELKDAKKSRVTNISYTQKNGFSENKFIFPNASECIFRNYAQDITVIEGGDCDLIWCDELVPLSWIETLRYRLVTRGGLLLITFTPIEGYSPAIKEFLDGARTVLEEPAPLLGGTKMPRIQHCVRKNACVLYFWTSDNPFGNYSNIKKTLEGAPRSEIKTRAYGVPTKAIASRFPKFREAIHVVEPEKVPEIGTRYMFVDPASSRNWFLLWVLVDPKGRHWVYREWPPEDQYISGVGVPGPWAEPDGRKADGKAGTAQTSFGWGIKRYIEEIRARETIEPGNDKKEATSEEIMERWMDSRFGNTPTTTADAATTLLEECAEAGMRFAPAPNDPIEEGVSLVNSLLDFDEDSPEPKLFISSQCKAVIFALKVWTGKDEKKGACKDPIDTLRWLAVAGLQDVGDNLTLVEPMGY
ncbi:MAG TPA: hypothetical protein VFO40_15650 [Chthoniobacterales bacterium]|nr:hypothetical protein [Chthoniobacterales bacterium]